MAVLGQNRKSWPSSGTSALPPGNGKRRPGQACPKRCHFRKSPSAPRVTAAYPQEPTLVSTRGTSLSRRKRNFGPYYKVAANKSQRPGRPFSSCDPRSENFRPAPATRSVPTLDTKTRSTAIAPLPARQHEPQYRRYPAPQFDLAGVGPDHNGNPICRLAEPRASAHRTARPRPIQGRQNAVAGALRQVPRCFSTICRASWS